MSGLATSELDRRVTEACNLHDSGDPHRAEAILHSVLGWDSQHVPARCRLAEIAIERHDHVTALAHANTILASEPNHAIALSHLAQALWLAGRITESVAPARRAVEVQPANPVLRVNLGQTLAVLGLTAEAEDIVAPLLAQPWHPNEIRARALGVIAESRVEAGDFEAARQALDTAVVLAPEYEPLRMAHALSLLRLGRLTEGWAAYRRRERIGFFFPTRDSGLPGQRWTGQYLRGRSILLRDEQGYGDAIQFFRYLPMLRSAGAVRIVLATFPLLVRLFRDSTRMAEVAASSDPGFQPDFHCMTGDLPGGFDTTLATIPASVPYLRPPDAGPAGTGGIGLAWSGDPRHLRDHLRSIPAERFFRLTDGTARRFVSLQNAVRPADLPALVSRPAIARVGERMTDFADTAAIVAGLDLVITVDTSIAHLAGALGKPVWVLLPAASDWRWLIGREDSPWYPTMRLFRAGRDGWEPVIERVRQALNAEPAMGRDRGSGQGRTGRST